jgi:cytochrome c553
VDAVARSLVPPAPHIGDVVGGWQPRELFWIVKHGIKMTAMPAWPSQHRDDEVWSMVAFLLALRDMSPETYRRMVAGPDDAPGSADPDFHTQLARCARCHGYDGRGNGALALPRIDGLSQVYLHDALRAYAAGERASGVMQSQASMVPARYLPGLARHFSRAGEDRGSDLPPTGDAVWSDEEPGGASRGSNASASWGRTVALQGIPQRRVPACAGCHGPASYPRAPAYPPLAGQPAAYLATQLRLFRDGHRGGSAFADVMVHAVSELDDRDIDAVAGYYARRAPGGR